MIERWFTNQWRSDALFPRLLALEVHTKHSCHALPCPATVQVDGAADSPSDSPNPRRRTRSRKRRSEAPAGRADGASGAGSEAEPYSATPAAAAAAAGGFNRTWSGLFVGSGDPQASIGPSDSNGARRQAHQAQQQQVADPARQPRGLARLLHQPAAPAAAAGAGALLHALAGGASTGHQPPHLMKTSQFRCASSRACL